MLGFYYAPFFIFIELKADNLWSCFGQRKVKLFEPINTVFASLKATQAFQSYPVIVWTSRLDKSVEFNIMSSSMSMSSLPCISDLVECSLYSLSLQIIWLWQSDRSEKSRTCRSIYNQSGRVS